MRIEGDLLIFDNGLQAYANCGIIGLSPELEISEGYDGGWMPNQFTPAQRVELADYMISQWQAYRALHA